MILTNGKQLISAVDRAKEVAAMQKDLNFDWFSERPADRDKRIAFADTVYEKVVTTLTASNPLDLIFDVRQGQLGTRIKTKELLGGKVYERSYGDFKKVAPVKSVFYNMTTKPKALHMSIAVEELQSGTTTTTDLVTMATNAILHYKLKAVWGALKDAYATDGAYTTDIGAAMSQLELDTAIDSLRDSCSIAAIWGRYSVLAPMTTYTGYDYAIGYPNEVKLEIHEKGYLGQYKGVPIIVVSDEGVLDEYANVAAIDTEAVFLIGAKKNFNRYVEVTPLTQTTKTEPEDGTFHLIYDFEDGFAIWKPKYGRRLWKSS